MSLADFKLLTYFDFINLYFYYLDQKKDTRQFNLFCARIPAYWSFKRFAENPNSLQYHHLFQIENYDPEIENLEDKMSGFFEEQNRVAEQILQNSKPEINI